MQFMLFQPHRSNGLLLEMEKIDYLYNADSNDRGTPACSVTVFIIQRSIHVNCI